jgi:ATP-dependent Zn protease
MKEDGMNIEKITTVTQADMLSGRLKKTLSPIQANWINESYNYDPFLIYRFQSTEEVDTAMDREDVAEHEDGHAFVAEDRHWGINFITVIPSGNYLGATFLSPPSEELTPETCLDAIAIASGGELMMHYLRKPAPGCGSDHSKQEYFARKYCQLTNSSQSPESVMSWQRNKAASVISSKGIAPIKRRSINLAIQGKAA